MTYVGSCLSSFSLFLVGDHFLTGVEISGGGKPDESMAGAGPSSLESVDDSLVQMTASPPIVRSTTAVGSAVLIEQLREQLKEVEEKCQELVREIKVRI